MKLQCPTLELETSEVTDSLLSSTIASLIEKDDPFLILERSEMSYLQAVWGTDGFWVEYQVDTLDQHFQSIDEISTTDTIKIFTSYLAGQDMKESGFQFEKKEIQSIEHKVGFSLGKIMGQIYGLFKKTIQVRQVHSVCWALDSP